MGVNETAVDTTRGTSRVAEWVLRGLVALALLGSAWVHLDVWLGGYRQLAVLGPLFLVNVVAGVVIAVGILAWRHWLPALAAVGFGAATLGAFLLSVTVGFLTTNEFGGFHGVLEISAVVTEIVCVLGGAVLVRSGLRRA